MCEAVDVGTKASAGKLIAKYGPLVPLLWKTAGRPAAEAAQKAFAVRAARNTALRHAETVAQGAILKVYDQGAVIWVVFSGADIVTSYPRREATVSRLVESADLSKKMTPEQFRVRRAERSARRRALDAARSERERLRRRRSNF
jgi:hypothetical protein